LPLGLPSFCSHLSRLIVQAPQGIPFVEINISKYPSKRADMLSLSNELTVPQIFFGNTFTVDQTI